MEISTLLQSLLDVEVIWHLHVRGGDIHIWTPH